MKVCKFGGSSLADSGHIKQVAQIIQEDPERGYIVVSAPGKRFPEDSKVTDLFYTVQQSIAEGKEYKEAFLQIVDRFSTLATELNLALQPIEEELAQIEKDLLAGADRDYAASRGEYLNGKIIAAFLQVPCVAPEKLIEIADDGTVVPESFPAMAAALGEHKRAVIPGFYGRSRSGAIKTFSRGGSDITGSLVARAVGASCYENWTDVSGVMMAHPGIVKNPKINKEMTFQEVRALALVGASVFHEEAVAPVRSCGIPINIRNTNAPADRGTWIYPERSIADNPLVGVAGESGYQLVEISHLLFNRALALRESVEKYLRDQGQVALWYDHMDTLQVVLKGGSAEVEKLEALGVDRARIVDNLAMVALVGEGIDRVHVAKAASVLEGVTLYGTFFTPQRESLYLVREVDLQRTIKEIYHSL